MIYRLAVGAVAANGFSVGAVAPTFLLAVAGSLVAGPALGWLSLRLTDRVRDVPTAIILQFVITFGVWIVADRIGLSGVLTMVSYAMTVARTAPERVPARIRIPSYAVWETAVFLLNVLAFVFIGLQLRPILESLEPAARGRYVAVAGAVLLTVIVVRIAWHMSFNAVIRWRDRRLGFHPPRPMLRPTVGSGLIISWSGMRGIVTLAAALVLPAAFPFRDLIVLTAFFVVLGTLVLQGLTLKPLLRALDLRDDDPVGHEVMLDHRPFIVVGVAKPIGTVLGQSQYNFAYIPAETYIKIYGAYEGIWINIQARGADWMERTQDEARVLMRARRHLKPNETDSFGILDSETLMKLWNQLTGVIAMAMVGVVSVFLVIGGVVIMNVMLATVTERTREIGIRKALGASRRDILLQFLVEACVMSAMGGAIGVLIAYGICLLARATTSIPMNVPISAGRHRGTYLFRRSGFSLVSIRRGRRPYSSPSKLRTEI
jgi:NhaP-type Na+/H+ or K+/H+ antiporter